MSKVLQVKKWITEHQDQKEMVYLIFGLWLVLHLIDLPWVTLLRAGLELLVGSRLVRFGAIRHVWPWYGFGLIGLGLATLLYFGVQVFAPSLKYSSNLYVVTALSPFILFAVFAVTEDRRWGQRQLGVPKLDYLLKDLESADAEERAYAVLLLGRSDDKRAVDALITALADTDSSVRAKAAVALGYIGDPRALPALQHITQDDYVDDAAYPTKFVAATAITRIQTRAQR